MFLYLYIYYICIDTLVHLFFRQIYNQSQENIQI